MNAHNHLLKGKGIGFGKGANPTPNLRGSILAWWKSCSVRPWSQRGRYVEEQGKESAVTRLSFAWAILVGLLSIVAQVVTFYIRFGFFNT
jgi:hypothetical protein